MALLGNDRAAMADHKRLLGLRFKIKDLGPVKQILGIGINYDRENRTLKMYQTRYIEESLAHYGITNS